MAARASRRFGGNGFRRTWPQRLVLLACPLLVVFALGTAWSVAHVSSTIAAIPRIELSNPAVLADLADPTYEPRNILILGATGTDGIGPNDQSLVGRGGEDLSDTMMLLRIDPAAGRASVLSIPRDLVVSIPRFGRQKINAAMAFGGPGLAVETVKSVLGVEINDFAVIEFAGFRKLVDSIGGVPVYFAYAARDAGSFFDAPPGCHVMNGEQSLNYVRSRHFEQRIDGHWTADNTNDYGRAERARDFMILALEQVVTRGGRNPVTMNRLMDTAIGSRSVAVDEKLTVQDMVGIGRSLASFNPADLQRYQLPTVSDPDWEYGLAVNSTLAVRVLSVFRGENPQLRPADVSFSVVDERKDVNADQRAGRLLGTLGFQGTAKRGTGGLTRTTVRFTSDMRDSALLVAAHLAVPPSLVQIPGSVATMRLSDTVTLYVGADFAGVRAEPDPDPLIVAALGRAADDAASGPAQVAPSVAAPTGGSPAGAATATATPPSPEDSAPAPVGGIIGRPPDGVSCTPMQ